MLTRRTHSNGTMVLVINLDEESSESDPSASPLTLTLRSPAGTWPRVAKPVTATKVSAVQHALFERDVQNVGSFSAALACYP